jgi:hypothetical protein
MNTQDLKLKVAELKDTIVFLRKELNKMKRVFDLLNVLKMSCQEGLDGDWDCSTEEGRESFGDMITIIEIIQNELKQKEDGEMFLNKG